MAAAIRTQTVEATVTVRVSQAAGGDLAAGARRQLERVDGVTVEDLTIAGVRPGLNDTTVEAVATLSVEDEGPVADPDGETAGRPNDETRGRPNDETRGRPGGGPRSEPPGGVADRIASRLADRFGVEPERVERVDPPE
ncbi:MULTISPECIES: hypothetical protein [unclassified Halorubrum]|uniref:hypothetical protein n=1 Tax=unclassified Halorubrum TaxID=2642239 RepID=UPI000B983733|nr:MULTISPECIES: hypothetical protein [unclassified Halorubrum]OYR41948.1 hypothetical protein DJ81_12070 [Halorubrum sp. Hd13]OYR46007.1 hypothetical protein DJ75_06770 [Halorubrum sp. Eb13]OYR50877.1 hypothetical protein DJ73_14840 [Halorubrum sp. Ea1]